MKKFVCFILAIILVLGLVGCNSDSKSASEPKSSSESEVSSEVSPSEISIEEILVSEKWKDVYFDNDTSFKFENGGKGIYDSNGYEFDVTWELNGKSVSINLTINGETNNFVYDFVQENDMYLLKSGVDVRALESDYEKAVTIYKTEEEIKVLEYYSECTTLPTVDSCVDVNNNGSSKRTSNGVLTKIEYKYCDANEEYLKEYIDYLSQNGFTANETDTNSYEIIENKYIIASIVLDGDDIVLNIVPEDNRQMSADDAQAIKIGDTIETKDYTFTLNNVELTYELKPSNTSSVYTSYPAEQGMIYIHIDGEVYNTSKRDYRIEDLFIPHADYNNGYKYDGFVVIDDGDNRFDYVSSYVACTPLASCHYHGLISCPEAIEDSTDPLFVLFTLADGITYRYDIR